MMTGPHAIRALFVDDEPSLETAEQIRALNPDVHIVLVSAQASIHPVDMSERAPPAVQRIL